MINDRPEEMSIGIGIMFADCAIWIKSRNLESATKRMMMHLREVQNGERGGASNSHRQN